MALLDLSRFTARHRAPGPAKRLATPLGYQPRHCAGTGTTGCLHNHPGDGRYGRPAAHRTVKGA